MRTVTALFPTRATVQATLHQLRAEGVPLDESRVITADPQAAFAATPESGAEVPVGTVAGTGAGSVAGGVTGWIAELGGLVAIEGEMLLLEGPLVLAAEALGPAAALGLGVGAIFGGLLGARAGWASVDDVARTYRRRVAEGDFLLVLRLPDRATERRTRAILRANGGDHIASARQLVESVAS